MLRPSRERGQAAEERVLNYLQQQGLQLITRNFHARGGEIDLILQDGDSLVFVEVRYRNGNAHGSALESITARKQACIRLAAQHFLLHNPYRADQPCRFDAVAVDAKGNVDWVRDAFA